MTINEAKQAVMELSDYEWDMFLTWAIHDHREYRKNRPIIEKAQAELVVEMVDAGKVPGPKYVTREEALAGVKPPAWVDPGTDLTKMYPTGAVVARKRRIYLSAVEDKLNGWEPGGDGVQDHIWRDITDEVKQAQADAAAAEAEETAGVLEDAGAEGGPAADGSTERPWPFEVGRKATKGQYVTYEGKLFRMAQDHTMVDHYRPGPGLESIYEPA